MELFKYIDQKDYYLSFARLADAKRVDKIVEAFKKLPAEKTILALAAYGYDWPREENKEEDVAVLNYKMALSVAKESQAKIDFDNDTYNLHYSYYDDDNLIHDVYFTDAATTFNAMRFAIGLMRQ